jgi:hypothetical protein
MTLKFEKSSEASLAVLSLVLGADHVGSLEERDFLFGKVKGLPMFGNPTVADFGKLLGRVTDAMYSQLPTNEGAITPEGVSILLTETKKLLTRDERESLLQLATELSNSDSASAEELALIRQLRSMLL